MNDERAGGSDTPEPTTEGEGGQTLGERVRSTLGSGRLPFLNRSFLVAVIVAVVLGAGAVLVNTYLVPDDVIDGREVPVRMDSFDRGIAGTGGGADGESLDPAYEPGRWQIYGGIWGINQGQATILDVPEDAPAITAIGWSEPLSSAQVRITMPEVDAGLAFRIASAEDYWAVVVDADVDAQRFRIVRVVGGDVEEIGTTQENSINPFGATLVTVTFEDDGFTVWLDGSISTRVRDDTFAQADKAAGMVAVDAKGRGARFDDFALFAEPQVRQWLPGSDDPAPADGVTTTPVTIPGATFPPESSLPDGGATSTSSATSTTAPLPSTSTTTTTAVAGGGATIPGPAGQG